MTDNLIRHFLPNTYFFFYSWVISWTSTFCFYLSKIFGQIWRGRDLHLFLQTLVSALEISAGVSSELWEFYISTDSAGGLKWMFLIKYIWGAFLVYLFVILMCMKPSVLLYKVGNDINKRKTKTVWSAEENCLNITKQKQSL